MKAVKSTDPRKPAIVETLKLKSGGNKVTTLIERQPGVFSADCMKYDTRSRCYARLGVFVVTATEVEIITGRELPPV